MNIREALSQLDPFDDSQWTSNGDAKVEVVSDLVGERVTREQIISAAPKFNRENQDIPGVEAEAEETQAPTDQDVVGQDDGQLNELPDNLLEMTDGEFVEFLRSVPSNQLKAVMQFLRDQQVEVDEGARQINDVKETLRRQVYFANQIMKQKLPEESNQQAIRNYIEAQQRLRAGTAQKASEARRLYNVNTLDPRSALDRAFARKTQRGTQRPRRDLL